MCIFFPGCPTSKVISSPAHISDINFLHEWLFPAPSCRCPTVGLPQPQSGLHSREPPAEVVCRTVTAWWTHKTPVDHSLSWSRRLIGVLLVERRQHVGLHLCPKRYEVLINATASCFCLHHTPSQNDHPRPCKRTQPFCYKHCDFSR